jgi:hypothetical protein
MLVCKEAARLISDACQRPLRWRERVALRVHLLACDACRNFRRQMRVVTEAARRLATAGTEVFPVQRLSDAARQRISTALAERPP